MSGVPLFLRLEASLESRFCSSAASSSSSSYSAHRRPRHRRALACARDRTCGVVERRCFSTRHALTTQKSLHEHSPSLRTKYVPMCAPDPARVAKNPRLRLSEEEPSYNPARSGSTQQNSPVDHVSLLKQGLQDRNSVNVLKGIVVASNDLEYLRNIPDTTFSEVIRLIEPPRVIKWAMMAREEFNPSLVKQMGISNPDTVVHMYIGTIIKIVHNRESTGRSLSLNDYASLLRIASQLRSKRVARVLWKSMQANHVIPDLRCYNAYLGAFVQFQRSLPIHSHRVIPSRVKNRSARSMVLGSSHNTSTSEGNGLREHTLSVLTQILEGQNSPDIETYRLIILGTAGEGDLGTVRGLLKNVWGVDVPALMANSDVVQSGLRNRIARDSPLFPNSAFLHAVAHAFAVNDDIATAIRVVDFISREFDLRIPMKVWELLFQWTFVLALPRTGRRKRVNQQLSKYSVQQFWDMMTSPPYNLQPTITMYNNMIKMCLVQQRPRDLWKYMQEGKLLYDQKRISTYKSFTRLRQEIHQHGKAHPGMNPTNIDKLRMHLARLDLLRKRDGTLVRRWVRLLLESMASWQTTDKDQSWSTIQIPAILDEWAPHAPRFVAYEIPGGRVSIMFRTKKEMLLSQRKGKQILMRKEELINRPPMAASTLIELGRKVTRRMSKRRAKRHA